MSETNQEREIRKLREEVYGLTKVLRKLTGVIEKAMGPVAEVKEAPQTYAVQEGVEVTLSPGQEPLVSMATPAAVATLRSICKDAAECSRNGCPIYDWCQYTLSASAPPTTWAEP